MNFSNGAMPSGYGAGGYNGMGMQNMTPESRPMIQQVNMLPKQKKDYSGLIKTIVIVVVSLIALTFLGLFIWMRSEYNNMHATWDEEIEKAVIAGKEEQSKIDEEKRIEEEKKPYKEFVGPEDYGQLSFQYPKTWSVYIAAAADKGGDFNAYFNPNQVDAVSKDTINALRVTINNKSFENVTAEYQKEVEQKDSNLTVESITVNGTQANRYIGTIPKTDLSGIIVIFKIRDKTVIMQTDNMLFKDDFERVLETVKFNA